MAFPRAELKVVADGRFLCVEVTNTGEAASFYAVVQPGRGTASAAIAKTALWHDTTDAERRLDTGQSARVRVAQRDRPATAAEADGRHLHPEGPQAWRMCFLKKGIGAALERVCPVVRRDGSSELDGVVLTLMSEPPLRGRTAVISVSFEGEKAIEPTSGREFVVNDSPRHYHAHEIRRPPCADGF